MSDNTRSPFTLEELECLYVELMDSMDDIGLAFFHSMNEEQINKFRQASEAIKSSK